MAQSSKSPSNIDLGPTRHVLVMTLGLTGAVVTETLWAIARERPDDWPAEIRLVATRDGRKLLEKDIREQTRILSESLGKPMPELIYRIAHGGDGEQIADIRQQEDAVAFGDLVMQEVFEITEEPDTALHVSIAGGRKTMSYHAGAALTAYGRDHDRLSHVLVDPPEFETRGFWWPDQPEQTVQTRLGERKASEARLDLADIPYPRLRPLIPEEDLTEAMKYGEIIALTNALLNRTPLELFLYDRTVRYGEISFRLGAEEFALYYLAAERAKAGDPAIRMTAFDSHRKGPFRRFLQLYRMTDYGEARESAPPGKREEKGEQGLMQDFNRISSEAILADETRALVRYPRARLNGSLFRKLPDVRLRQRFAVGPRGYLAMGLKPDEIVLHP